MAQVKTNSEIAKIQKACSITDAIFKKIISHFTWETEIELRDFISSEIRKRGLKPSFPPIVTSGARAGNEIHPQSTNARMKGFVIIDMGVVFEKYMSDMTRTIFVGVPTKKDRALYEMVLNAKIVGERFVIAGGKTAFADLAAREMLGSYNKYFIHTLGHGVGTRIHEAPRIYWKQDRPSFRLGMVVTVEPGIYIPNTLGIRIEDTGVVTTKGYKKLTRSTLDLVVIPFIK